MLWPTTQLIENHWNSRQVGKFSQPHYPAAEIHAWPSRREDLRRIAEPASNLEEAQANQDCRQLQSTR
jgi:hypothetical protein